LPGHPPAPGKYLSGYHSARLDSGLSRRLQYWLFIPDNAPAPMPLLVMLHGCEQSATQFADGTRMNQVAASAGYAVLYPQQSLATHPHRCWKWYDRDTQQGGGDVRLLMGMLAKVIDNYAIDRQRIYVSGISAGAGMAQILALNHPGVFAGLGVHSGPMFGAGHSTIGALGVMQRGAASRSAPAIAELLQRHPGFPPLPAILIHGEADQVVRPVNQTQLVQQMMLLNRLASDSPVKVRSGRARKQAYRLSDVYQQRSLMLRIAQVDGLAHAWSGGDERLAFNSALGPDASKMMLDFFGRHRRR
jgi:poly(hydroxyalkanoate) depolymerase family esterase